MKQRFFFVIVFSVLLSNSYGQLELNSSGNVGIGDTPNTYKLYVKGNTYFDPIGADHQLRIAETSDEACLYPNSSNSGYLGSYSYYFARTYTRNIYRDNEYTISDNRIKTNIREIENPLLTITQLNGVRFDFTAEAFPNETVEKRQELLERGKDSYGFIAQDIQEVIPKAVIYDSISELYYLSTDEIIPILVEAMKEQQSLIEELQSEMDELQSQK